MRLAKILGSRQRTGMVLGAATAWVAVEYLELSTFPLEWMLLSGLITGGISFPILFPKRSVQKDTVVYTLRKGRKVVYIGVAYLNRAEFRVREHRRSGKLFDQVEWSPPQPRAMALETEKKQIRKYRPRYNIAHNY